MPRVSQVPAQPGVGGPPFFKGRVQNAFAGVPPQIFRRIPPGGANLSAPANKLWGKLTTGGNPWLGSNRALINPVAIRGFFLPGVFQPKRYSPLETALPWPFPPFNPRFSNPAW